jgi:hypothetical protein
MSLEDLDGPTVYADSVTERDGTTYFMARQAEDQAKVLGVKGDTAGFAGTLRETGSVLFYPLTAENAAVLRDRLPWLKPVPLGLRTSAGFGDRLGMATPGHVQAVRGTGIVPIFAQQSVRENARTGRTPQQVLDEAMWGAFQAGWREAWGADADHLKTLQALEPFVAASYSFYTVDPSDFVDKDAETDPAAALQEKVAALPWAALESSPDDLKQRFLNRSFSLEGLTLTFDEVTLLRAAAKYGKAVSHIADMYRQLKSLRGSTAFDFEVSVDETDTPTAVHEHLYIAAELRRLAVEWVSLAPRFVGRFEKGVDYIGDQGALDANLAGHAAVMRYFGGYKLSLHSGSDKFTVYPLAVRHTRGLVHLKTAGTSYLEALRVWAKVEPDTFRAALDFARARYEVDRATYHVSAALRNVPAAADLPDAALPGLLDQFDARQVLHVTFGSVLDRYGDALHAMLACNEARYADGLQAHFERHLRPFIRPTTRS